MGDGTNQGAAGVLEALWQDAPVGLVYVDTDMRYRWINSMALRIGGASAEARLGRTLGEVHGAAGEQVAQLVRRALAEDRPVVDARVVGRLWHGRAPEQALLFNCYPVHGREGALLGVGIIVCDVTEKEHTRGAPERVAGARERLLRGYRSLIVATSEAVWIREPDGSAQQDSPSLRAITGQSREEYLGWGYLDAIHPADREAVRRWWAEAGEEAEKPGAGRELTYRLWTARSGCHRWFRSRAVAVHGTEQDPEEILEWAGTETDVDDEVRSRRRRAVLERATLAVNEALDPETELQALAEAVVPEFADMCRVYLVDEWPTPKHAPVRGRRSVTRVADGLPPVPGGTAFEFGPDHPLARSVRTGAPELEPGPPDPASWPGTDAMLEWSLAAGVNSRLVAPVVSGGAVVAALLFVSCGERQPYTVDDLALVRELAVRASAAVEQGRRFQQTRQVSLALQESMLSDPPPADRIGIRGVELDARYLPAAVELEVGGDWYDAFRLAFGDLAIAVGDVAGHDLAAAATMGQLRSMLRALAYDTDGAPSDVLRRLDRVASRLDVTKFTTLLHGRVLQRGADLVFRWSNAGHPVPILVETDGSARFVGGEIDVVLGVDPDRLRHDQEIALPPGSTLLLYTDGLIENRENPSVIGEQQVLAAASGAARLPLDQFCDEIVRARQMDNDDDVVVLALRTSGVPVGG